MMERFGRVVQLAERPQGLRASYRAALLLCTTEPWSDEDVVSYIEDDYLFTEDAFLALAGGDVRTAAGLVLHDVRGPSGLLRP